MASHRLAVLTCEKKAGGIRRGLATGLLVASAMAGAQEANMLKTTPLAHAFGSAPVIWGAQLSPDGSNLSVIQAHPSGTTVARVVRLSDLSAPVVLSGNHEFNVTWCSWANDERLLCGLRAIIDEGLMGPVTRLVATDVDGTKMEVLLDRPSDPNSSREDRVLDFIPDDREHVLIPASGSPGLGVARLNIYNGALSWEERAQQRVSRWLADGYGTPRLYSVVSNADERWMVRRTPDASWERLRAASRWPRETPFTPLGFTSERSELVFLDEVDQRRLALFADDLTDDAEPRLLYSSATFDVIGVQRLGKHKRAVAATYFDDRLHWHVFDARVAEVQRALSTEFPGQEVGIADESWDQRYYLVFVRGPIDPGTYYRYDAADRVLVKISVAYPSLAERALSPVMQVRYAAADGTEIPAYLTLPNDHEGAGPAVVMLGTGVPHAADYWSFNFIGQYLAANGYAVLQVAYRGSTGYGKVWEGDISRDWRRALADVAAGTDYLIGRGIADPERISLVGWGDGGYMALLSAIEDKRYRSVTSIAGFTQAKDAARAMDYWQGDRKMPFSDLDDFRRAGSPLDRVEEIDVPVQLVHGKEDVTVRSNQSTVMARALARAGKRYELIEYTSAEHDLAPERYRIDLLARLGEFLADP